MGSPNQPAVRGQDGSRSGNLYDVLDLILDRGIVIDVYVRVSLLGLELLQIDARIVVASVDTYLRFAEATNRLDLEHTGRRSTLPGLINEVTEGGSRGKAEGAVGGAVDAVAGKVRRAVGAGDDEDEEEEQSAVRPRERERKREPVRSSRRRHAVEEE
ncbi:MAG TPA: gas vesicle protein GvpJ [Yinghuangia sp.]|uniref:gas vesicle protein GvpJ n=1 Tax=Yinghuangia sp. YIM S10712 TaxID=3436930 RepID=UPI002C6F5F36|nr:gas vesicle protein GvpJ [Yinghuangia sp.]